MAGKNDISVFDPPEPCTFKKFKEFLNSSFFLRQNISGKIISKKIENFLIVSLNFKRPQLGILNILVLY